MSVFWNPDVRCEWGKERNYKGCMGTRLYSESSDVPFKNFTRVWHKVSQVFFFVFFNSSDLPQPSFKWCQYSTLRMFSVQRIKELSSELAGYDYLRKRWTKRKVYCVCDLWSAVWSFDVFFGIPKTIVLEILDWSILYELLISFNPISSML